MNPPNDLSATLAAAMQQLQQQQQNPAGGWAGPTAAPTIASVAVPIKVQTPAGSIRVYLSFPGEVAATPQALLALLQQLQQVGLPLDFYPGGTNAWGGSQRGGWNGGGGNGYGRRGWR